MYFSKYITCFLTKNITNLIGSISLIIMGIISFIISVKKYINQDKNNNFNYDITQNNKIEYTKQNENYTINYKNIFLLCLGICPNNIATSIAASITGISITFTTIFTFITSFLFIYIGNNIGKKVINKNIEKYSEYIAALILILIGIFEMVI